VVWGGGVPGEGGEAFFSVLTFAGGDPSSGNQVVDTFVAKSANLI